MRVVLLALLATYIDAGMLDSSETRVERSNSADGLDRKLRKGSDMLRNVRNVDNTVRFLEQLQDMENEKDHELSRSPKQNTNSFNAATRYVEIEKDHVQPMGDTIEEINQNSEVDTALFQGDMILTNEGNRNKRQAFRDRNYPNTLWSNGVFYSFDSSASQAARSVFRKAAATWQSETCINFSEANTARNKIVLTKAGGCWSSVGRIGGAQQLSLGNGCETVGTAAHEIGHALGLFHTQSRHDRDNFITLKEENFMRGWLSQFTKQSQRTNYNYNLTYDYGSVMHYGARSVSKNGQPVMVPRDMKYLQTLGSPIISFYDKLMINLHYKCLDKCTSTSSASCQNGGFPHPRDCSKCICPSGYGGRLCNERPNSCGKVLTATTSFQTLRDSVGGSSRGTSDEFMMCNYWVTAPAGSTIEVVLDSYTRGVATDGCSYAGVEIKTGKDKRHTGYRFCSSNNIGTSLTSTHNIVPIITYSGARQIQTVLRYRIASSGPGSSRTTAGPRRRTTRSPTDAPQPRCEDSAACAALMERDFCSSPVFDDSIRRLICPQSCGFC